MQRLTQLPDQFTLVLSKFPCPTRQDFKSLLGAKRTKILRANGKYICIATVIENALDILRTSPNGNYILRHWWSVTFSDIALFATSTTPPSLFVAKYPESVALRVSYETLERLESLVNEFNELEALNLRWNRAVETLIEIDERLPENSSGRAHADAVDTRGLHLGGKSLDRNRKQALLLDIQTWFDTHRLQ